MTILYRQHSSISVFIYTPHIYSMTIACLIFVQLVTLVSMDIFQELTISENVIPVDNSNSIDLKPDYKT